MRGLGQAEGNNRYNCLYCKLTFGDLKYARIHMVMKHKEILGGKLEELQKNKRVEELNKIWLKGGRNLKQRKFSVRKM